MARGRYQQGIGVPETLGVQPTTWTEPKSPTIQQAQWSSGNVGVSRNYGSTPGYVDTLPHRWSYGQSGAFMDEIARGVALSRTSTSATSPFDAPPSGPPATGAGVPPVPPSFPPPTGTGLPVPPAPTSIRRASTAPAPFSTPPVAGTGSPVPSAPSIRQSQQIIKSANPMDIPPMPEFGGDFLTASAQTASDKPFQSSVEWKDAPENPFPKGSREDFNPQRMFDPEYLPAKERSTSPANSRTQNRRPKTI